MARIVFVDVGGVGADAVVQRILESNPGWAAVKVQSPLGDEIAAVLSGAQFVYGDISWDDIEKHFADWSKATILMEPIARASLGNRGTEASYVARFAGSGNSGLNAVAEAKANLTAFDFVMIAHKLPVDLPRFCAKLGLSCPSGDPKPSGELGRKPVDVESIGAKVNAICADRPAADLADRKLYFSLLEAPPPAVNVNRGTLPLIAFVSPIFPQAYGVPVYSLFIAKTLSRYARLDLLNPVGPPDDHARYFHAHIDASSKIALDEYDNRLFVMGNNSGLHRTVIDHAKRANSGVCIHHDAQLLDTTGATLGRERLRIMAERALGYPFSARELDGWFENRANLSHPMLTPLGDGRFLDVVHSPVQREIQTAFYPHSDIVFLPHAIQHVVNEKQITPLASATARAILGIPADQLMIASCGAVNTAKRADDVIFALCHLHDWGVKANLYFVGTVEGDSDRRLFDVATRLGLQEYIHFSGRVSEERYMLYLAAADVGLQLRLSLFGQLSGAVIDCLAAALPTIAPNSLVTALEGPSFARRLPDAFTSLDVAATLEEALAGGRNGVDLEEWRSFVDEHSFERYGARLAAVLGI